MLFLFSDELQAQTIVYAHDEDVNGSSWCCCAPVKKSPRASSHIPHKHSADHSKETSTVTDKEIDSHSSGCGICCFRKSPTKSVTIGKISHILVFSFIALENNGFPDNMDDYSVKEFNLIYDDTSSLASAFSGRRSTRRSKRPVEHV